MSRAFVFAVAATAGLALLTGCTKDEGPKVVPASAPPSASAPADPSAAPDATVPASDAPAAPSAAPSTAPAVPAVKFKTPQAAVDHLLNAWEKKDKTTALQAAGPLTTDKVFALPAPATVAIEGCEMGKDTGVSYAWDCYYRYEGGSSRFYVNPYAGDSWRVVDFKQIAD